MTNKINRWHIYTSSSKAEGKACRHDMINELKPPVLKPKTSVKEMTGRPHVLNLQVKYTQINSESHSLLYSTGCICKTGFPQPEKTWKNELVLKWWLPVYSCSWYRIMEISITNIHFLVVLGRHCREIAIVYWMSSQTNIKTNIKRNPYPVLMEMHWSKSVGTLLKLICHMYSRHYFHTHTQLWFERRLLWQRCIHAFGNVAMWEHDFWSIL